jgi:Ca-activated chloride channel homolog
MNTRPLPTAAYVAAGVALALTGCALMGEPAPEPRAMYRPAPSASPATGEAEAAPPAEAPEDLTASVQRVPEPTVNERPVGGTVTLRKNSIQFSDDSIEGDLTKPDGEYVTARKRVKHSKLIRVPETLGPDKNKDPLERRVGTEAEDAKTITFNGVQLDPNSPEVKEYQRALAAQAMPLEQPPVTPGAKTPAVVVATPTPKPPPPPREENTNPQDYLRHYGVNPTVETNDERFSTFAADVDTGSYTISRAYLDRGQLPPEAAIRVEEVVNAFDYGYRAPEKEAFAVQVEAFPSPNRKGYHVLHLGLKGREISASARKPASLVFTIDVSGSMSGENRLGLVKKSLNLLLAQLGERDQVSIVVYGDSARVALPPTNAADKDRIAAAIFGLRSEGSTNVQAGLELAYAQALRAFNANGVNRVILLSDGVANNGITTADGIFARVKARASEGITLTTVGFGMGEYNDVLMERLADQGDGQYAYVDKLEEARRIFVEQLTGTLQVIARDVKLQLEFNPEAVARYRLLGFENRALSKQDFHDDKKDAGELGAGHSVTAVYEVKFKSRAPKTFATFRARFKEPRGVTSGLVQKELPMSLVSDSVSASSGPARLSLVAAGYAEKLRGSYWARNLEWGELIELWDTLPEGLKVKPRVQELRALMLKARALDRRPDRFEPQMPVASMDFDRVPVLR